MSNEAKQSSQVGAGTSTGPPLDNWRTWLGRIVLGIILLVHGWLTVRLFPSWTSLVNNEPVVSVDHAIHIYHGYLGARFLKEHATSWGYDPFFMAGYPKTPVYDSSSGPSELFQLVAGGSYSPRAYKIGILLLVGLIPVVIVFASHANGAGRWATAFAAAWTVWSWWVGFPDILVRTGLVAFVWSSALAVLVPALFVRWCETPHWKWWLSLTASTAAGIQAHSIFPVMVFAPLLCGYLWRGLRGPSALVGHSSVAGSRWHAATWAAVAVALAATFFWWWPLLRFLPLKTASDTFMIYRGNPQSPVWRHVADLVGWYMIFNDGRVPALMVIFGVFGLVSWFRSGSRRMSTVLGVQLLAFSALTFAGSELPATRNLEPLRFQVPLGLAWAVAAGLGVSRLLPQLNPLKLADSRMAKVRWLAAVLFIAVSFLATVPKVWWWRQGFRAELCPPSTWTVCRIRLKATGPLAVGLLPEMKELVAWIQNNTDDSARILFEDQLRLLEGNNPSQPESLHWTPLLPLLTGRQFVGGLYHMAFIPHQHAGFGDWHLAGRNIRQWTPDQLRAFCDQYNIGWVITWSRASPLKSGAERGMPLGTEVFSSSPFCEPVAVLPRHTTRPDENAYTIFRVHREHTFFARGRGRVARVDYNRIELTDLEPEGGELVLRYHWQEGLRSKPPLKLGPAPKLGDPIGFIRIATEGPLDRLLIYNSYR